MASADSSRVEQVEEEEGESGRVQVGLGIEYSSYEQDSIGGEGKPLSTARKVCLVFDTSIGVRFLIRCMIFERMAFMLAGS